MYGQAVNFALLGDAPDAQVLASDLGNGALARGLLRFDSATHRGAQLTGLAAPVEGMATYLRDTDSIQYYTGSAWVPLTPGPWVTLPLASGISARSGSPAYRLVNGSVQIRGTVEHTDASVFPNGGGATLATLPAGYRPTGSRYHVQPTEWTANIHCRVEVLPTGEIVAIIPVSGGSSPHWIGLDGIEYSTA
jgi:hypothetical protein